MTDTEQDCINAWNDFAEKWNREFGENLISKVMTVNPSRRSKLKARMKQVMTYADHYRFRDVLEGWNFALDKIEEAGWMFGDNQRGWIVGFDNLIGEKFFIKLMEGGHNRATGAKQQNRRTYTNSSQSGFAGLMDFATKHYAGVDTNPRDSSVQDQRPDQKQGRLFA